MYSIALVVFREVFEISLMIGILMAATRGLPNRTQWVWIGGLSGMGGAVLIAIFADAISQTAQGMGQEILNAAVLLIASVLIGWTTIWMTTHGQELSREIKQLGREVIRGDKPMYSLAFAVCLTVLREGAEIVMFTYGAFLTGTNIFQLLLGGLLGIFAGSSVGIILYYGLIKVPTRQIFSVTSFLLILLVAGMTAQAFGYLTAAGKVPEIIPMVWDTSRFISDQSMLGMIMHVLIGYTDRPTGIQIIVYAAVLIILFLLLNIFKKGSNGLQK